MDSDVSFDWSKLSKKERKKLARKQKERLQLLEKRKSSFFSWFGIGIVVFIILFGIFWIGSGLKKDLTRPLAGKKVEDQGRQHIPKAEWEKFNYNSNPPTSGSHDAEWKRGGVYEEPQGDGYLVHSLEHGYIVISHNCEMTNSKLKSQNSKLETESAEVDVDKVEEVVKAEEVDKSCLEFVEKLKDRVEKDSWKLILVPQPNLDTNVALTAWGRIDKFGTEEFNMERVENFIKDFRGRGPEQAME